MFSRCVTASASFAQRSNSARIQHPRNTLAQSNQKRFFNLHEYQSHQLFEKFGIHTPKGFVASTVDEAYAGADAIGGDVVVKAQVLAGGRGRGTFTNGFKGGVHKAYNAHEAKELASKMLGQTLITLQTGLKGKPCNKVFIQERVYSRRELYFAILLDRASGGPVIIGSAQGGMSIEDVAKESPEAIVRHNVNYLEGLKREDAEKIAKAMGFGSATIPGAVDQIMKLYDLFVKTDATLVEVNPMIETPKNQVICADAKINIDDNAHFRQAELFAQRDTTQEDYRDVEAAKHDLNYIGLDGTIGCLVNGAGLAMATMDVIKLYGGEPANFLDVGGGATQEQIIEAFKLLNSDRQVQAILVNIFGGIMRCDVVALGLINAATKVGLRAPLIVRLQGTNVKEAKKIMEESGVRIISANNLDEAASKAVQVANIVKAAKSVNLNVNFEIPI